MATIEWSSPNTMPSDRRTPFICCAIGVTNFVYHVDAPAQLFDLVEDPAEVNDLAIDPDASTRNLLREREDQLRAILDPELTDKRAKADQRQLIEDLGGRDAVVARGSFINSPVPGEKPTLSANAIGRRRLRRISACAVTNNCADPT